MLGRPGKGETLGENLALWAGEEIEHEPQIEFFGVFEENWESVNVFLALRNRWQKIIPPMGGTIIWDGLRWADADVFLRRSGIADQDAVFADLLLMEDAAMRILNAGDDADAESG
ncbi:DUF1799 domain-containing protein [Chitinimonas sp.]|uniref:DUF1799 domain-containing protein n=1 Tax=Chitinimonas sp. TaxID=1934313 RepID=UPI0035AE4C38